MSLAWRAVHQGVPTRGRVASRRRAPATTRAMGAERRSPRDDPNITPPLRGTRVFLSDPDCFVGEDSEGLPVLVCPSAPDEDPSLGPSYRYLEFDFSEEEEKSRGDAAVPPECTLGEDQDGMPTVVCE